MVKPLQLFSLAMPSLATKTDSQVMLQVANLNRGAVVQNLHNSVNTMQNRMESMLEDAIRVSGTPTLSQRAYDIMSSALDEIEAQLLVEKKDNDQEWVDANNAITQCETDMNEVFANDGGTNALKKKAEDDEKLHKTCRADEDDKNDDEKDKYDAMKAQETAATGKKPKCLTENGCLKKTAPREGATEAEKIANDLANAERVRDCLKLAGEWSEQYERPQKKANDAFKTAEGLADAKVKPCDDAQDQYETSFCDYKVSLDGACTVFDKCVKDTKAARASQKTILTDKQDAEKIILKACGKVRCYMQIIHQTGVNGANVKQADYDACRNNEGQYSCDKDTKECSWSETAPETLNVDFDPNAEAGSCNRTGIEVYPGHADWYADRYAKLEPKADSVWRTNRVGLGDVSEC